MLKKLKFAGIALVFALLAAALVACGGDDNDNNNNNNNNNDNNNNEEGDEGAQTEEFGDDVDWEITGIDPGAGIMNNTEAVLDEGGDDGYELADSDWTLEESSESAMLAELESAVDNEEPIIITGWKPHQKFEQYDLTMLDDPKEIYGGEGDEISAMANKNFKETAPAAFEIVQRITEDYDTEIEQDLLVDINVEDQEPEDVADEFIEDNRDMVDEWLEGADDNEIGEEDISLPYIAWAGALARTPIVKDVLEEAGYNVDDTQVEAGPAWQAIADDDASFMTASWLPATHGEYWDEYEDDLEEIGVFVEKAPLSLAVPDYVVDEYGIESIEDLITE